MKKALAILLLLLFTKGFSQTKTTYYDDNYNEVATLALCKKYVTVARTNADTSIEVQKTYLKSGQIIYEYFYTGSKKDKLTGTVRSWYNNGDIRREVDYKDGMLNGTCKTYWPNGEVKREDVFENDKLVLGNCYTPTGEDTAHYDFEVMPEFKGGVTEMIKYVQTSVKYPNKARKKGIQGRVLVKFIVEKDGSITNATIINSVNNELDAEALRVVQNMPAWTPGYSDGDLARVTFRLPISFKLK